MPDLLTSHTQDYLKAIYALNARHGSASTTALAGRLGISPASVTGMLKRLAAAAPPLVAYRKYQGVSLTPEGEREALKVIRSHRLLEAYLVQRLGYSWDAVHEEACRLEHVISPDFEARIAAVLGDPRRDPHGELIPTTQLTLPRDETRPLSALHPPQQTVVRRVEADAPDFLRYLESVGLVPGACLELLELSPYDQNLRLRVQGQELVLGPAVTGRVFVETLPLEV
jgi:DtxR family Mn-dependent transcriptional regulator